MQAIYELHEQSNAADVRFGATGLQACLCSVLALVADARKWHELWLRHGRPPGLFWGFWGKHQLCKSHCRRNRLSTGDIDARWQRSAHDDWCGNGCACGRYVLFGCIGAEL